MKGKKDTKGKQKKARHERHETNEPRILTAEGWWREKGKQTGQTLRPKPGDYDT